MPVATTSRWAIDYVEVGQGPSVILLHSSVSGSRQWRSLMDNLGQQYRMVAINLFGYGKTTPWPEHRSQTLADQCELVQPFIDQTEDGVAVVGHSFGGAVAMKAALANPQRVTRLVLLEPNPFRLLDLAGRSDAFAEARALGNFVKRHGATGDWETVAAHFADYWNGDGTWSAMSPERRAAFTVSIRPNFHEWDGVLSEDELLHEWPKLKAKTLVVSAADTKQPMAEIVRLLEQGAPHWRFAKLSEGGHMFPLTRPDLVNPLIADFLRLR